MPVSFVSRRRPRAPELPVTSELLQLLITTLTPVFVRCLLIGRGGASG